MLETTFSTPVRSVFVEEAATMLGVSRRTIYYRIREGRLRTMRTRCGSQRVLHESIDALLREDAAKRRARTLRNLGSKAEALTFQVQSLP
jgi:excisionase family DNA binding protein